MSRPPDVIVVGAGIVGCAVAYELARRGVSVDVVEERRSGMGATQASAGMLAPHIEAPEPGPFLNFALRSLGLFDDFIARVEADSGASVSYRRTGTLQVATTPDELRQLEALATSLHAYGISPTLLDARAVRAEEPHLGSRVAGGLVIPMHGFVDATGLLRALAAAARHHGAQVVEGCRVRSITPGKDELRVETDRGSLVGSAAVLAAGSWSGHVDVAGTRARIPVKPVRGQLLRLGWRGHGLRRVTWGPGCYLVPWEDGTLLVGATMEDVGFDESTTVAGIRGLIDAASKLVPDVSSAAFLGARAGLRPASTDELPIIGPSRICPNLTYATAHFRSGVLLSPITAALVADLVADNVSDPDLAPFSPGRFASLEL